MPDKGMVLYIGGFELPDRNAAAQRVVGIAKGLRDIGYEVKFVNALKEYSGETHNTKYFGFRTLEYKREGDKDYLFGAQKAISIIKDEKPNVVIAYNYPAVALNKIRIYCQSNKIKCVADVTEWPKTSSGSILYRIIKELDTLYRMRYVHKHMDSVIAISRFLYDYYKPHVPTVIIPPTVDMLDEKWNIEVKKNTKVTSFVYAGSPSPQKEKLDSIVKALKECSRFEKIVFNVVGITEQQFLRMYSWKGQLPKEIVFWGRLPHKDVIRIIKESTWAIILREDNTVVRAGFPTKLVESISCGTPVLINAFSNVVDYLDTSNSIIINDADEICTNLPQIVKKHGVKDCAIFDYRRYMDELNVVI